MCQNARCWNLRMLKGRKMQMLSKEDSLDNADDLSGSVVIARSFHLI